jgi:hypothetical protein
MMKPWPVASAELIAEEWVSFPGGELQGTRPKARCRACRALPAGQTGRTLCFHCYRADAARQRALVAAAGLQTASDARFQFTLPFEPVNRARLETLHAERRAARVALEQGSHRFELRRRQAQIAARRALERVDAGPRSPRALEALRAAELQLPDAWLPYVCHTSAQKPAVDVAARRRMRY